MRSINFVQNLEKSRLSKLVDNVDNVEKKQKKFLWKLHNLKKIQKMAILELSTILYVNIKNPHQIME